MRSIFYKKKHSDTWITAPLKHDPKYDQCCSGCSQLSPTTRWPWSTLGVRISSSPSSSTLLFSLSGAENKINIQKEYWWELDYWDFVGDEVDETDQRIRRSIEKHYWSSFSCKDIVSDEVDETDLTESECIAEKSFREALTRKANLANDSKVR